jgi:hypothetical protein
MFETQRDERTILYFVGELRVIADLGGRFDFLLGYDFMRHYRAYTVPETGQLRGYDADGSEFISKSNYSYSRVLDSIEASDDASARGVRRHCCLHDGRH